MLKAVMRILIVMSMFVSHAYASFVCGSDVEPDQIELLLNNEMRALRERPSNVESHSCIGDIYFLLGRFPEAEAAYKKALKYNKREVVEADILQGLASSIKYLGRYDEAIEMLQRKLEIDNRSKNSVSRSQTYATLASIYGDKGESRKSIEMSLASVDGLQSFNDKSATYNNVAMAYVDLKDYEKAHIYIDKAIGIDETHESLKYLGIHKINKGMIFQKENGHDYAVQAFVSGISLVGREKDKYWELQGYSSLALSYYKLGKVSDAINALDNARSLARDLGRKEDEAYFSEAIVNLRGGE